MFEFRILAKQTGSKARAGSFQTPHGELLTPELAFVATEGEIKAIPKVILKTLPIQLIIVNTFHLWTKKIKSQINSNLQNINNNLTMKQWSNIHTYSGFPRVIMSDSGGFQVFSLGFGKTHGVGKIANIFPGENAKFINDNWDKNNPLKITDQGVQFRYNDQDLVLTPEKSIDLQHQIGADIIFAFDECTSPLNTKEYTKKAMERTHEWLKRCIHTHKDVGVGRDRPALFAIIQGGAYKDLRMRSAKYVGKQDAQGFGIGGSLGKTKEDMLDVIEWVIPYLPDEKPRHLLGIGQVRDIFEGVERGVDLFDCVIPTREARHKVIYTIHGKVNVRKMRNVDEPLDKNCQCLTCKEGITYQKLHDNLFFYATVHNIQFFAGLMEKIRNAIGKNRFFELKEKVLRYY